MDGMRESLLGCYNCGGVNISNTSLKLMCMEVTESLLWRVANWVVDSCFVRMSTKGMYLTANSLAKTL